MVRVAKVRGGASQAVDYARQIDKLNKLFNDKTSSLQADIRSQNAQLNKVSKDVSGLNGRVKQVKGLANSTRAKVDSVSGRIGKIQNSIDSKISKFQNGFNSKLSKLANSNAVTRKIANGAQNLAQKANALGQKANALLAKFTPLLALIGVIGSILALVASFATLKTLGARIDQVERGLEFQSRDISKIYSIITPIVAKVRRLNDVNADEIIASLTGKINSLRNRVDGQIGALTTDINGLKDGLKSVQAGLATITTAYIGNIAVNAILSRFPWVRNKNVGNTTINNYYENNIDYGRIESINARHSGNVDYGRIEAINKKYAGNNNQVDYTRIDRINKKNNAPLSLQNSSIKSDTQFIRREMSDISRGFANVSETIKDQVGRTNSFIRKQLKPIGENVERIKKRADSLYNNQFTQAALNALNTAFLVHNAGRLSIDATLFVGDVLNQLLNYAGINFTDENESNITLNQAIGSKISGMIDAVVPATFQNNLSELYLKTSTIFRSGANIFWAVEGMKDTLLNVTEIANDRLGLWMNTARDERLVSFDAYPHQPPISSKTRYGRVNAFLDRVNRGTEGWTNAINEVEDGVSTVSYVASVPVEIGQEISFITEERGRIAEAVGTSQNSQAESDVETLLNNEAPETLTSTQDYLPDEQ